MGVDNSYKSSSAEQQMAEELVFYNLERKLGIRLERNKHIYLANNVHIEPDFYSEVESIIGEIFVHIGKPKKAQNNKIANDILKMILLEKVRGKKYRKMIVVCDKEEEKTLYGTSYVAESIRQFDVEIIYIELDEETRSAIFMAQKRQRMVNQ